MKSKILGFTLVEVLVSVVILTIVVTTVSMVYRTASTSSDRAKSHVKVAAVVPGILQLVRTDIRNKDFIHTSLTGRGKSGEVKFSWDAKVVLTKAVDSSLSPSEFGLAANSGNIYYLWQVSLYLDYAGLSKAYQFSEVSWRDQ